MPWIDRLNDRQMRRLTRDLQHQALVTGDLARDHLLKFGRQASEIAGHAAHQVADYGRHEGATLAKASAVQASRAARAMKADPVPVIVGLVAVALLANLVLGRRRRT